MTYSPTSSGPASSGSTSSGSASAGSTSAGAPTVNPPPVSPPKSPRKSSRMPLVFAFVVIVLGGWLLLEAFGVSVPRISRIWPLFIAVGGVASLLDFLIISRRPRSAGQAVIGIGLAIVGFAFSNGGFNWAEFLDWLPALPIVVGLGMLTTWAVAGRSDSGLFGGSLVVMAIGVLGIFARFDILRDFLPSAQIVWAVGLLCVGILVAWRVFNRQE